mgnify:FL=1
MLGWLSSAVWATLLNPVPAVYSCCTVVAAAGSAFWMHYAFLKWNENRSGLSILNDPVFTLVPPYDTSELVAWCQNVCFVVAVYHLLVTGALWWSWLAWCVFLFVCLRCISITLCPLHVHPTVRPLREPLAEYWARCMGHNGRGYYYYHDLFFSGHTTVCCMLWLMMPPGWPKTVCGVHIMVMAAALVVSRAHYSIDVFVAPFMAFWTVHAGAWTDAWCRAALGG